MKTQISIIDYSILTPYGDNVNSLLNYLLLSPLKKHPSNYINRIDNYNANDYLGEKGHKYFTTQTKYLLSTIIPLWKKRRGIFEPEKLGIVTGTCFASIENWVELGRNIQKGGYEEIPPMNSFNFSLNIPSSLASIKTQAQALNVTLTSGISTGYDAICFALDNLRLNSVSNIITSGVEYIGEFILDKLIEEQNEQLFPKLSEGSLSILFSKKVEKDSMGVITSYNSNFSPTIENVQNDYNYIVLYENINKTISEAMAQGVIDVVISATYGNNEIINLEKKVIHDILPNIPIIQFKVKLGELLSLSGIMQYILACNIIENPKLFTPINNNKVKNVLVTYMGVDGYIYSSIITKQYDIEI